MTVITVLQDEFITTCAMEKAEEESRQEQKALFEQATISIHSATGQNVASTILMDARMAAHERSHTYTHRHACMYATIAMDPSFKYVYANMYRDSKMPETHRDSNTAERSLLRRADRRNFERFHDLHVARRPFTPCCKPLSSPRLVSSLTHSPPFPLHLPCLHTSTLASCFPMHLCMYWFVRKFHTYSYRDENGALSLEEMNEGFAKLKLTNTIRVSPEVIHSPFSPFYPLSFHPST